MGSENIYLFIKDNEIVNDYNDNVVCLTRLFEKYDIPKEYRKIIVSVSKKDFKAYGYNNSIIYELSGCKKIKKSNNDFVVGTYNGENNTIIFNTYLKLKKYNDVVDFFDSLQKEEYLFSYFKALGDFFDIEKNKELILKRVL